MCTPIEKAPSGRRSARSSARRGFVGLLLPFEHQPDDQRREHRRQGVDLASMAENQKVSVKV